MATAATATAPEREPVISVIMTVRDGAPYLAQALASLRAQTFTDWELVVRDDGSTDDTLAILTSFVDPRIRCFAGERVGRRQALVEAHAAARGRYLAWLDADDYLAPDALAKALAALVTSGCDMVYTDHTIVGSDGELRGIGRRAQIPYSAHRLLLDFMTFHFRLFTREIFERVGGISPEREIAIDYDLCLRISELGRVKHLAEPLYFYRRHAEQMSSRRRAEQIAASAAAIRAAIARRGLAGHALDVDEARGRFRLVPPPEPPVPSSWLRIAAATASSRWRPAKRPTYVIGHWPTRGDSVYRRQLSSAIQARGMQARALGPDLARLVRMVWTGRAGDALHVHDLSPLFATPADGSALAACAMFLKTIDHALARGMRVVWISSGPLAPHPRHAARHTWCVRQFATRCDAIVTHWRADATASTRDDVGPSPAFAPHPQLAFLPHPHLGDGYPHVTREFARQTLGVPDRTAPTQLYMGAPPPTIHDGDLVLDGDVDAYDPRHVAAYFAVADVVVLPRQLTAGSLALAMAMGKPIVAPAMAREVLGDGGFYYDRGDRALAAALEHAHATRDRWDALGRANGERARVHRWEPTVDAVV